MKDLVEIDSVACRLCGVETTLRVSHLLPAFIFRWLRESAGGVHIRNSNTPNQRVQDGEKRRLLCDACEQLFSGFEKLFADRLFYPYLSNEGGTYAYGPWLSQFCTSVSWRVLVASLDDHHLHNWQPGALDAANAAELTWREYLLGARPHPGMHRQHLVPFSQVAKASGELPTNINRYLTRAIQMDLLQSEKTTFTFAKLGRFVIIGFIRGSQDQWKGTKVHVNHGSIGRRTYTLPAGMWNYFTEKASAVHASLAGMSDVQQRKVEKSFELKRDTYFGSDAYEAMQADIEQFGSAAFRTARDTE